MERKYQGLPVLYERMDLWFVHDPDPERWVDVVEDTEGSSLRPRLFDSMEPLCLTQIRSNISRDLASRLPDAPPVLDKEGAILTAVQGTEWFGPSGEPTGEADLVVRVKDHEPRLAWRVWILDLYPTLDNLALSVVHRHEGNQTHPIVLTNVQPGPNGWGSLVEDTGHGYMPNNSRPRYASHVTFVAPWDGDYYVVVEPKDDQQRVPYDGYVLWVAGGVIWNDAPDEPSGGCHDESDVVIGAPGSRDFVRRKNEPGYDRA